MGESNCPWRLCHTCQVGEVQKREISLFASWKKGRFCAKPFCDIYFIHQRSNSGWNFENDEIFHPLNGWKLFIWCKIIVFLYLVDTLLTDQCILENSTKFLLFKEKIIGRWRGPKRGRFPLLGGRWGQKEGDLTCMALYVEHPFPLMAWMPYLRQQDVLVKHRCPKWQVQLKQKIWSFTCWPQPKGHVMWLTYAQHLDRLAVKVWSLHVYQNLKYNPDM